MKRLNFDVDEELFAEFKAHCASAGRSIRDEAIGLIRRHLGTGDEEASESELEKYPLRRFSKKHEGAPPLVHSGGHWKAVKHAEPESSKASEMRPVLSSSKPLREEPIRVRASDVRVAEEPAPRSSNPLQFEELGEDDANWLALLIDAEGAIGWTTHIERKDKVDEEYRHIYRYTCPYISVDMNKIESTRTMEEAGRLMGVKPVTWAKPPWQDVIGVHVEKGRALAIISNLKPYFDKYERLAELMTRLFKHRTHIRKADFERVLVNLFGEIMRPKDVNENILRLDEEEFRRLIEEAEEQADLHLT